MTEAECNNGTATTQLMRSAWELWAACTRKLDPCLPLRSPPRLTGSHMADALARCRVVWLCPRDGSDMVFHVNHVGHGLEFSSLPRGEMDNLQTEEATGSVISQRIGIPSSHF